MMSLANEILLRQSHLDCHMDLGAHYKGVKTLITGGCSFIGSHLAERLVALGSVVTVVDDLSSGKTENIRTIVDRIKFTKGDLRDFNVARQAVDGQSVVFHLANVELAPPVGR